MYSGASPGVESGPDEDCSFEWLNGEGAIRTGKDVVDGGTSIMTEDDQFIVGADRQLF